MLPLPGAITSQLDKASIIRLTISYLKLRDFSSHGDPPWNRDGPPPNKSVKGKRKHLLISQQLYVRMVSADKPPFCPLVGNYAVFGKGWWERTMGKTNRWCGSTGNTEDDFITWCGGLKPPDIVTYLASQTSFLLIKKWKPILDKLKQEDLQKCNALWNCKIASEMCLNLLVVI